MALRLSSIGRITGPVLALALVSCAEHTGPIATKNASAASAPYRDGQVAACRTEVKTRRSADAGMEPPIEIYCGASTRPSAVLFSILLPPSAAAAAPTDEAVGAQLAKSEIAGLQQELMQCRPGVWLDAGGIRLIAARCVARDGGWPTVSIGARYGDHLMLASGFTGALPSLARLVRELMAENRKLPIGREDAEDEIVKAIQKALDLPPDPVPANDLDAFHARLEAGRLYEATQDDSAAERAYLEALEIQTRALGADNPALADTILALALATSNQGRSEDAERLFRRAAPLLQGSADPLLLARANSYQALAAASRGSFVEALGLIQAAIASRREAFGNTGVPENESGVSATLGTSQIARGELLQGLYLEAAIALKLDNAATAESAIMEGLELLNKSSDFPLWWRPRLLLIAAEVERRLGKIESAEAILAIASETSRKLFGETGPTANVHFALGRLYYTEGLPGRAVDEFRLGRAILLSDTRQRSYEQNLSLMLPYLDALYDLAAAKAELRDMLIGEMFEVSQSIRGGVAAQTQARTALRLATSDPELAGLVRKVEEASRERDLLQIQLAAEVAKPAERRDSALETAQIAHLKEASVRLQVDEETLNTRYPNYRKLLLETVHSVADVQANLSGDEALFSLIIGRTEAYGFVLTPKAIVTRKLPIGRPELEERVGGLRQDLTLQAGRLAPFDVGAAHELYEKLLAPFASALDKAKRLIVIPAGALTSLPVSLLVMSNPPTRSNGDYTTVDWLAKHLSVTMEPSFDTFVTLRRAPLLEIAREPLFAIAAPSFRGAAAEKEANGLDVLGRACRGEDAVPNELIAALTPLPETEAEVRAVATVLHAPANAILVGPNVSKGNLRAASLANYRILYFATHGLLPGELRCESEPGLALSPPNTPPTARADDGLLVASEIARWRLNADLVVLSACNTASSGGALGGQALSGLAESFFFAGSRAVLASHWPVSSKATAALMTRFFATRAKTPELSAGEALRASETAIASQAATSHPFYWAPFVIIGDDRRRLESMTSISNPL
jgi:CHAT domain-containing protein/tetratricopeptide (TPR) repeat protein